MHEEHCESICTPLYQCIPLRCVWTREKRRNNDCYDSRNNHNSYSNDGYSNDGYSTTATPTTVYSLEDAQKVVFEAASNSGTDTVTLYYKDDVLLKEEKVSTFIISKVAGDNPLEMLKKAAGETKEKLKVLIGKGVEYHTDYKDDVFTITYSYDYTKIDIQKLKEINPHIPLRDDNTRSYSQYRDALLDANYVEK